MRGLCPALKAEGEDLSDMGINLAAGEKPSAVVKSDDEAGYLGVYQQSASSSMDVYPGYSQPPCPAGWICPQFWRSHKRHL
jgi:hypothetical protein